MDFYKCICGKGDNALGALPTKSPNSAQLRKKSSSAISADDEIIIRKVMIMIMMMMNMMMMIHPDEQEQCRSELSVRDKSSGYQQVAIIIMTMMTK